VKKHIVFLFIKKLVLKSSGLTSGRLFAPPHCQQAEKSIPIDEKALVRQPSAGDAFYGLLRGRIILKGGRT
jgi:hypothetical protein